MGWWFMSAASLAMSLAPSRFLGHVPPPAVARCGATLRWIVVLRWRPPYIARASERFYSPSGRPVTFRRASGNTRSNAKHRADRPALFGPHSLWGLIASLH